MKMVVQIKLLPDAGQSAMLGETLTLCNRQANFAAEVAQQRKVWRNFDLRKIVYTDIRTTGLSSQLSQSVVKKATDAIATRKANMLAGRYGKPGSARRDKVMAKPVNFRLDAAHPFDDRVLSWDHQARTVSIWTIAGRQVITFTGNPRQLDFLAAYRKGESDLVVRGSDWFLIATCDVEEPAAQADGGMIGIDMGVVQIATTMQVDPIGAEIAGSGMDWSGGAITARRSKNVRLRAKLQAKGTKSAKRLLKKRSKQEARFVTDTNHVISKQIVAEAKRTGRGIAVEDLVGIRERVRLRKPQRAAIHSWAFAQLGQFLAYKATLAGVAFVTVDPAYTSQTCSGCGHVDRGNRLSQAEFCCRRCGVSLNADTNAAVNIARRGVERWAVVSLPNAAKTLAASQGCELQARSFRAG